MRAGDIGQLRSLIETLGMESKLWPASGLETLYNTEVLRQRVSEASARARATRQQARLLRLQSQLLRGVPVEMVR